MVAAETPMDIARVFSELTGLMLSMPTVEDMLCDLVRLAATTVEQPASCGITVRRDSSPVTVASSDTLATALDEVQYGQDAGPCLQALRTGEIVEVTDMSAEHRWGDYPAHAVSHGVMSSLSVPMVVDGDLLGALNLYATAAEAFTSPARELVTLFTGQASAALTVLVRQGRQAAMSEQLREALAGRSVIDQALGIIMGQQRCNAEQAFAILRRASQNRNIKVRDIAARIVTQTSGELPTPRPFADPA